MAARARVDTWIQDWTRSLADSTWQNVLPLSAYYVGSFAYKTIKDRLPIILTKAIDVLHRDKDNVETVFGQGAREQLKKVIGRLSKLRNEMETDKPLVPIKDDATDVQMWNTYLENLKTVEPGATKTWFSCPWLFVECYMYRRMREAFNLSLSLKSYDPFREQKESSFTGSLEAVIILARHLENVIISSKNKKHEDLFDSFCEFIQLSLWGNKCDLSISSGVDASQHLNPIDQLGPQRSKILVDDTQDIFRYLVTIGSTYNIGKKLSLILDNAGFELFSDLCLADFLVSTTLLNRVDFYVKEMPWYVSDTTLHDFTWMLDAMAAIPQEPMAKLASRWKGYLRSGTWAIVSESFWTLPHVFNEMMLGDRKLYETLMESGLVIFKGDLNYRKLTGDKQCDTTNSFVCAIHKFAPAPLCALRTLKCDMVVGLKPGQAEKIKREEEDWMFTGNYGVIQFNGSRIVAFLR